MTFILNIFKWILIILFFPLSLIFVGYYKQKRAKKEHKLRKAAEESTIDWHL